MPKPWIQFIFQPTLTLATLTLAAIFLVTVGCAQNNDALVPVTGIVTMDGRPVAELIVTFTPMGNTLGNGALGGTDTDGHFTLADVRGGQGAYAGEYKVSLYPTPSSDTAGLPTDVVSSGKAGIPPILLNPNKTPLRATVPETGAEVEIALSSKIQDSKVNVITYPVTSVDTVPEPSDPPSITSASNTFRTAPATPRAFRFVA